MFGMGFFEILMVAVVAIIFLGPEKLPKALVDVAKFFKAVKKTIDDAKESLDKEVRLSQIKEEALAYKNSLTQEVQNLTKEINLKSLELSDLDFKEKKQKDTPKKPLSFQENHLQENQESQQDSSPSLENSNPSLNVSNQAQNPSTSPQKSL